ncbi:3-isopropylmalate/(R)-2-methylmalate dehydratase large subunit [Catenulispora sp. MAP12-49]|uniref:3-isopropylmalate dehydratase large subunit n=1 Tax=Catenulispora sp. MAP12-49 TaxID=3156302 RepID=UPI0035125709
MSKPGMTMIERILARKAGLASVAVGDTVTVDVDMTVLIDLQFATMWLPPLRIADPAKVAIVMDHAVPAPTIKDAAGGPNARKFAAEFGIERFYDVGRHGICHQVIAENGLARPGEVLACTDSHTCAGGAYNTAARGLGPAEVYSILCTGRTWFQVSPTIRYELTGQLPAGVSGKDVFLHIANQFGDATNHNLEYGGPGLASVPLHDRRTIATQGAEISADFSTFAHDDVLADHFAALGVTGYEPADADPDAVYADVREIDLSALVPYVARPGTVSRNGVPVAEVEARKIDQAFIGSCANGQLDDLRIAAEVLRGKQVAPGVRLIVTPASQQVYRDAMRLGYLQDIADAGAVVTNATCGACFGYHMGVVGPGEVCLTSSTRNFTGRMGSPEAEIYMASPATVAASAIAGHITAAGHITITDARQESRR